MAKVDRFAGLSEFLAVADHTSFRAAAAELGVTRAAVSQAVQGLEHRLGQRLFQRTTRSVALNDAGARLLATLRPAADQIGQTLEGLSGEAGQPIGTLRLTVPRIAFDALSSYSKPVVASPAIVGAFVRNRRPPKHGTIVARCISPAGILSDPKVFKSERRRSTKPAWSTTMMFAEHALTDPAFEAMVDEAVKAAVDKWPSVSHQVEFVRRGKDQGRSFLRLGAEHVWLPFRDSGRGETCISLRKVDDPEKNVRAPEVIGRSGQPIKDPREIYSGVRARVSLGVSTYANSGNKGVSFGLNNVQKLGDAPPLGAGSIAEGVR